jgi:hypothetical protein
LRKSHYDYAAELFFGFVGGGLAIGVFERQHKLDNSVAHVAWLVINGPDLQSFERRSASARDVGRISESVIRRSRRKEEKEAGYAFG